MAQGDIDPYYLEKAFNEEEDKKGQIDYLIMISRATTE